MKKSGLIIGVICMVFAAIALIVRFSEPVIKASASLGSRSALVGDKVKYAINVIAGRNIAVEIPDADTILKEFNIFNEGFYEKEFFGKKRLVKWYIIIPRDSGGYLIPGCRIRYMKSDGSSAYIYTQEMKLAVRGVMKKQYKERDFTTQIAEGLVSEGQSAQGQTKRIETPICIKIIDVDNILGVVTFSDAVFTATISIAILLIVLLIMYAVKKILYRPITLSPYEKTVKQTGELELKRDKSKIDLKDAYFELSGILRSYIKSTFSIDPAELTTKEFLNAVDGIGQISAQRKGIIRELMQSWDLVKFSGQESPEAELKINIESAKTLVNEINDSLKPETDKQ